jgi:scavenger receptor class B, member 1
LFKGVEVYWFTPSEYSIHDDLENPDTSCYCDSLEKCYKKGIGNVSPCYHGALFFQMRYILNFIFLPYFSGYPLSVSQPHFYASDESLRDQFVGLNPQKEKHQTKIAIQPVSLKRWKKIFLKTNFNFQRLGITINFQMRTQLNLMTGTTKFNSDIDKFDNLAIPLGWVENVTIFEEYSKF